LLVNFEKECRDRQGDEEEIDLSDRIIREQVVERLIRQAAETKVPCSELARLVNRSLYE
jgi:hypothetical protein